MAWPSLPASLTQLTTSWDNAVVEYENVQSSINAANTHWGLGQDHEAIQDTLIALQDLADSVEYMLSYIWIYSPKTLLCKVLSQMRSEYKAATYDLTMGDILSTMLSAEPDEVEYFVGLVDAYRQSIWNKPFNSEFFAALARGFEEWP